MIKFFVAIIFTLSFNANFIDNFDQLYDIFFQSKKGIIIFTQNQQKEEVKKVQSQIENILDKFLISDFYEIKFSNCEKFESFCELENLKSNQELIYLATKYDNNTYKFSEIDQLEKYLQVNIQNITWDQLENIKDQQQQEISIIFAFDLNNEQQQKQVKEYIKHCVSDCYDASNINNYLSVDLNQLPQNLQVKNKDYKNQILVLKNKKIEKVPMQKPTFQELVNYLNIQTVQNVQTLTEKNYLKIFNHPLDNKFYFFNKKNECKQFLPLLEQLRQQNQEDDLLAQRILFTQINIPNESQQVQFFINRLLGEEEIENNSCILMAQRHKNQEIFNYIIQIQDNTTFEEILQFKEDFLENKLKNRYLRSEKIQENQKWENTSIDKITAKNFEEKIRKNDNDFFLVVVEENNINSTVLAYFIDLLQKRIPDLQTGILDYSKNETPLVKTQVFPTFLYYHKNAKHQPAFLADEFSYEQLVQFFNQHSQQKIEFNEELKKEFLEFIKKIKPEDAKMIEDYMLNTDEL